jgi:catechol 2,3-dioxygenase-like lactoylglutathione lyase family enzyme
MEINGIAHIFLTVSNYDACLAFYEPLLNFLGLKTVMKFEGYLYCVGGRTAVGISQADSQHLGERFVQHRVGLHHLCFRARERADVDACYEFVKGLGATIVHAPEEGAWAPGYYSLLFEDPDGIRLEINHVPGKGLLAQ